MHEALEKIKQRITELITENKELKNENAKLKIKLQEKKAYWIPIEYDGYADGNPVYDKWECSKCGCEHSGDEDSLTAYCPDCGRKMEMYDEYEDE